MYEFLSLLLILNFKNFFFIELVLYFMEKSKNEQTIVVECKGHDAAKIVFENLGGR